MPEFKRIPLADIDEPQLPARVAMDEGKMQELAGSMAEIGLLQPISLKRVDLRYEIEAGHRRFLAAKMLKWRDIPALVFEDGELVAGAAMLAENIIREDLNAAEEAVLFAQSQDKYSLDEDGLVARFRRTPDYIADRLRLLRDDSEVFNALLGRKVNFSVARELNKCGDEAHRRYLLDAAIRGDVGARTVAGWVRDWRANTIPEAGAETATVPATLTPEQVDGTPKCIFCGGSKDPWNLVNVYIHKWELAEIQKVLGRSEEHDECVSTSSEQPKAE